MAIEETASVAAVPTGVGRVYSGGQESGDGRIYTYVLYICMYTLTLKVTNTQNMAQKIQQQRNFLNSPPPE